MFTIAERRALDQLSTSGGRLGVVAADQRTKLVAAREAAGLPSDIESLRAFKLDLVQALGPNAPGMLLDPEIALPHVLERGALPARTGLLVSLERSGPSPLPAGCGRRSSCPMSERAACAGSAGRLRSCSFACAQTVRTPAARMPR